MIKIQKGLNLPITGEPSQSIEYHPKISKVALVGPDYAGMKPTIKVKVGDSVKLGQVLFEDKKTPGVLHTSPGSGKVSAINRGEKRSFQSIEITLEGNEEETFQSFAEDSLNSLKADEITPILVQSGLWTSLKTRPFSRTPKIDSKPHSIFVNTMNTEPLAIDPKVVIEKFQNDFTNGLIILSKLTKTKLHLCQAPGNDFASKPVDNLRVSEFSGLHPAGLPGTHIHHLDPVSENKTVWTISYQDVIAIGKLFTTGKIWTDRIIAVSGPGVGRPALATARVGANISEITKDLLKHGETRSISGSVLSGRQAEGPLDYLGRFDTQVTALAEGRERELLGWKMPGFNKFSIKKTFAAWLIPGKKFEMHTNLNGSPRAMVPVGSFERVMPLDILPTFLLRAILSKDIETAVELGLLELDEEDLSLCTFVCPGKTDYGPLLRDLLTQIEKEG